jgi:glutathione S-transferase
MKLYSASRAPNPRRVLIYLAEKRLSVPICEVDLGALEQRSDEFTAINPFQRTPALVLDEGSILCESIAICRYFEELHPDPPLFGVGALERAKVEMWQRRLEHGLLFNIANAFRHAHPAMQKMEVPQIAEVARTAPAKALEVMAIVDRELRDRAFIAGDAFTVADITGLVALDFTKVARIAIPEEFANLRRWRADLAARPSAKA